jgi:hypothetical protein
MVPHIVSIRSTLGPARFTRQQRGYKGRTSNAAKRGRHHFFWNCVALLHRSSSKRRLQITTGIDRAPRPAQPDFATLDLCRGIDRSGREIRVMVSHGSAIVAVCLSIRAGGECNQSRSPVWEGLAAALSIEMMMFDLRSTFESNEALADCVTRKCGCCCDAGGRAGARHQHQ